MAGLDLAQVVSTTQRHVWTQGEWGLTAHGGAAPGSAAGSAGFHEPASAFTWA